MAIGLMPPVAQLAEDRRGAGDSALRHHGQRLNGRIHACRTPRPTPIARCVECGTRDPSERKPFQSLFTETRRRPAPVLDRQGNPERRAGVCGIIVAS